MKTKTRFRQTEAAMRAVFFISIFWAVWMPSVASIGGLTLRVNQIVLPFVVFYLAMWRVRHWRYWPRYVLPLTFVWLAFLFWTVLAVFGGALEVHSDQNPLSSVGRVFLILINFVIYGVSYLFVLRSGNARPIVEFFAIAGAVASIFGVLVLIAAGRGIPLPNELVLTGEEPVLRGGAVVAENVTRQYGSPNKATFLAGIAVMCLVMATDQSVRGRLKYAICGGLCALGVILGIARGAVLAGAVGCVVLLLSLLARAAILKVVRAAVIAVLVIAAGWGGLQLMPNHGGQTTAAFVARLSQMKNAGDYTSGTAGERLELWTLLLKDVRRNPFWGNGLDAYQRYYPEKTNTTENFFIEVLHATGVWGFVPLLGVIIAICWRAWRTTLDRRVEAIHRAVTLALLACYVAVLAGSLTNSLWGGGLFWTMLGLLAGAVDVTPQHRRAAREALRARAHPATSLQPALSA